MSEPEVLRFDGWVDRCLYDPLIGFYATGRGRAGRRGDFLTSPEVGPLFGASLARALDEWWDALGQPARFPVVDAGAGPGTLLKALALASPRCAEVWQLRAVDVAPGMQPDLGDVEGGVVIANELLDNLPFRVLDHAHDNAWSEVFVAFDEGGVREVLRPASDVPDRFLGLPAGRLPWLEAAGRWVGEVLERQPACLLVFDYGRPSTGELMARGGWLRTYRRHERGSDPYRQPGQWDLTTDVGFDQLPAPSELATQAEVLRRYGIDQLVDEGRAHWQRHAAHPDLTAMRMRSRVREAEALLDPDGLGGWMVATWASDK